MAQLRFNSVTKSARILGIAVAMIVLASSARASFVADTLGPAGPGFWAILTGPNTTDIALNGPGTTTGNVGVSSPNGNVQLNASSGHKAIDGNLVLQAGATVNNTAQVTGSVSTQDLSGIWQDAVNAASTFTGLAPTSNLRAITSAQTITVGAGLNVLDASIINLNQSVLTFNGPAGAQVVVNISNNLTLNGAQIELTGGLTPMDIVFNVEGPGSDLHTSGGLNQESIITGILLAPDRNIAFAPGEVDGELIAGGQSVHLVSGGSAVGVTNTVPEPATTGLLAAGLMLCAFVRRRMAGANK